ncbi:hypothetical protein [Litoribacter populi]|uniref:hypothetical protein n=1 Tax=Litoribacter populi TaxID=2598460 RepID=UPI00117E994C|nr:hypothetical protein [Litoribacter populi]
MYTGFLHLHSYLAYLVIIGISISFIYAMIGALSNREFTAKDQKFGLFGLIPAHIQLLAGLVLYFISPLGVSNFGSHTMGDATSRLYALEHPLVGLIAVILITVGYSRAKKISIPRNRYRSIYIFYGIGLLLILSRIPWSAWLN